MDSGPTYLLIVALCVVGVLSSFILFLDRDNQNIAIIFSTIISIVGFAYGYQVYKGGLDGKNSGKVN